MINHVAHLESADTTWDQAYKISGAAAFSAGMLLLLGVIDFVAVGLSTSASGGWLSLFQNNWLVLIFKLHAGFSDVHSGLLHRLNLLDLVILTLVGVTCLGLYAALKKASKLWSIVGLALPFIGIILFIATQIVGRSSVMGAALIFSVVMLRSSVFDRATAWVGILAGVLLLAGDFSVGIPASKIITALFGIGFVLLAVWFFMVARKLAQMAWNNRR